MTIQHHLSNLASLHSTVQQAEQSLTALELRSYRSLLGVCAKLISYAPSRVRRAVIATLSAQQLLDEHIEGSPAEMRERLLTSILRSGKQDVLAKFAFRFIFPDVSINDWCHKHDVAFLAWTRQGAQGPVEFISFDKVHHTAP
jgi:hypothetical protein